MINIISKITDYIICKECSRENWYENDSCIDCGSKNFRDATEKDADRLREYCEETEGMDLGSDVDI